MNITFGLFVVLLLVATTAARVTTASRDERERSLLTDNPNNLFLIASGVEAQQKLGQQLREPSTPMVKPTTLKPAPGQAIAGDIQSVTSQGGTFGVSTSEGSGGGRGSGDGFGAGIASDADSVGSVSGGRVTTSANERRRLQVLQNPEARRRTVQTILDLQDKIIARGGCSRNLCFALDASTKLQRVDFLLQRDFVALIAATLGVDDDVNIGAYQYGPRVRRISRLSPGINAFLLKLEQWEQSKSEEFNFLAAAIWRCRREMRPLASRDANKLVIIGNGDTSSFQQSIAQFTAQRFLRDTGAICAVAVEDANRRFFAKLTDDPARVLGVEDYFLFDQILSDIVSDICGLR